MKTFRSLGLAAAAALACTAGTAHGAINLVANGGFETGGFDDWDQFGDQGFTEVSFHSFDGIAPSEGDWQATLGPLTPGSLSQTLATRIDDTYRLSFALANEDGGTNFFGVNFGGQHVAVCVHCDAFRFRTFRYDFRAFAPNTTLEFDVLNPPGYWHLDNVSVRRVNPVTGGVPEPATWTMMIVGLAGAGAALRASRRRRTAEA